MWTLLVPRFALIGVESVTSTVSSISAIAVTQGSLLDAPSSPTLAFPLDNAANLTTILTFRWTSSLGTATYHCQIATDSNFASLVLDDSTIADTAHFFNSLSANTTYYWRVRALNGSGTSDYSAMRTFTTIATAPSGFLVRTFETWPGGIIMSTDPAGIGYHAPSGHLFIADPEISEIDTTWTFRVFLLA